VNFIKCSKVSCYSRAAQGLITSDGEGLSGIYKVRCFGGGGYQFSQSVAGVAEIGGQR
jgi:hypothetical protein